MAKKAKTGALQIKLVKSLIGSKKTRSPPPNLWACGKSATARSAR